MNEEERSAFLFGLGSAFLQGLNELVYGRAKLAVSRAPPDYLTTEYKIEPVKQWSAQPDQTEADLKAAREVLAAMDDKVATLEKENRELRGQVAELEETIDDINNVDPEKN